MLELQKGLAGAGGYIAKQLTEKMGSTITAEYENGHLQSCIAFQ